MKSSLFFNLFQPPFLILTYLLKNSFQHIFYNHCHCTTCVVITGEYLRHPLNPPSPETTSAKTAAPLETPAGLSSSPGIFDKDLYIPYK